MKKLLFVWCTVFVLASCNNNAVEKPDNLIDEAVMTDILYDLSIMEAIKAQNPYSATPTTNPKQYIFKKYKIDSVQFALSNRYYVSQIEQYKKMYDKVAERIEQEKQLADKAAANGNAAPAPSNAEAGQVQ